MKFFGLHDARLRKNPSGFHDLMSHRRTNTSHANAHFANVMARFSILHDSNLREKTIVSKNFMTDIIANFMASFMTR